MIKNKPLEYTTRSKMPAKLPTAAKKRPLPRIAKPTKRKSFEVAYISETFYVDFRRS